MSVKTIVCSECEAEFKIAHEMDEDYYDVKHCPFCAEDIVDELNFDEE